MSICPNLFTTLSLLIAVSTWIGCTPSAPTSGEHTHSEGDGHDHDGEHPSEGPHHGHLIELGNEEYHAELTHDDATKTVSIYLLDNTATKAVSIADTDITLNLVVGGNPMQVKLGAVHQQGDPSGQASCFSTSDPAVFAALEAPKTAGRVTVNIGGKSYVGVVEHAEHEEHEHD